METEEFIKAIECRDFAIGDTFWLCDIEFEVVNKRKPTILLEPEEQVVRKIGDEIK